MDDLFGNLSYYAVYAVEKQVIVTNDPTQSEAAQDPDETGDPTQNPPAGRSAIPVRSQRKAMDWSLVLASQGILSTIVRSPDRKRWALWVDHGHVETAVQAIRRYRQENQPGFWESFTDVDHPIFHWGGLVWIACLIVFFIVDASSAWQLRAIGAMDNQAVFDGDWWRLMTSITLHVDVKHLAANATSGFLLFGLAMARFGAGVGLLLAFLAGIGGNLLGLVLYGAEHRSVGASGMVLGALGMISVQALPGAFVGEVERRTFLSSLMAGILLFVLVGLNPQSDLIAHLGGFVTGIGLGLLASPKILGQPNRPALNGLTLGAFTLLVALGWGLALR